MYRALLFCLLFSTGSAVSAADFTAPKKVTILGTQLVLKYHQSKSGQAIWEYVPKAQSLENWKLLYAIRSFKGKNLDPKASVVATGKNIEKKKAAGDPVANYAIFKNADGSYAIDFVVSNQSLIEHNIFKYIKTDVGLVWLQVARRIYLNGAKKKNIKKFFTDIPKLRGKILTDLDLQVFPGKQAPVP